MDFFLSGNRYMKCALAFDDTLKMSVTYSPHCHSALISSVHSYFSLIFPENHGFKVKCVMMMIGERRVRESFFDLTLIHFQLVVLPLTVTVKCHF